MKIVVLVDSKGGIAKDGKQMVHIKEDLKNFRELTMGHTVIMGRKTADILGKPLPGRKNLVVTSHPDDLPEGFIGVSSVVDISVDPDAFVIGGERVYEDAIRYCLVDEIFMTVVDKDYQCDQFFPSSEDLEAAGFGDRKLIRSITTDDSEPLSVGFYVITRVTDPRRKIIDPGVFMAVVTQILDRGVKKNEAGDLNDRDLMDIVGDLSITCFTRALLQTAAADPTKEYYEEVFRNAQGNWMTVVQYAKDVYDVELHPLAMLGMLRFSLDFIDNYATIMECIDEYAAELVAKAEDEVKPVEVVPIKDEDRFEGTLDEMITEYFRLIGSLGRFYADRNRYETEEDRHTHDIVVDLFNRIRNHPDMKKREEAEQS